MAGLTPAPGYAQTIVRATEGLSGSPLYEGQQSTSGGEGKGSIDVLLPASSGVWSRNAFYITTEEWLQTNRLLTFWINPSETQWRIATRTSIEQIQGGAVHHEWRTTEVTGTQPDASKFDMPTISFAFQSGNITLTSYGENENQMPPGVDNFYDFLEVLNQPTMTKTGAPNYVNIYYATHLFPEIYLQGYFSADGVQWTETADNPNMITGWGASFIVFSSNPPLTSSGALKERYNSVFGFASG